MSNALLDHSYKLIEEIETLRAENAKLREELELTKMGENFHDQQANTYAKQVGHWIEKFDKLREQRNQLVAAANAVVNRWHTPLWKDVPATANYINALNAILAEIEGEGK